MYFVVQIKVYTISAIKHFSHDFFAHYRDGQSRELTSVRTRNIELDTEVERIRRQLTNERFERYMTYPLYISSLMLKLHI